MGQNGNHICQNCRLPQIMGGQYGCKGGVIHIGFLSSTKIFSPDRKSSRPSGAFCCLRFCRATLTYRNVLDPSACFAPACSLWIHSSSLPTVGRQLFRAVIHPDLGRTPEGEPPAPAPSRHVGTRTTSVPYHVQSRSVPKDGRDRPNDLPHRKRHSTLCDSWCGRKSFRRTEVVSSWSKGNGGRPIRPVGSSQPLKPRSTAVSFAHPNTRVRSKFSCRFII